jgi:serine/threonine protein kinase
LTRSLLSQRYVPIRLLASGGMGEVYLARQTGESEFQRQVAMKRIHRRLTDHPRAVKMFLDEARLAAALSHPNIIQIYDVGEEDGTYFIVMERVSGTDLRSLAETTTRLGQMIPMELAINIIVQVLEGLRYAHTFLDESGRALRIVHRDIGPNNILVSFDGIVKIGDFGLARAEDELRQGGGLPVGKFSYMSPEMIRSEAIDARTDLFSVGVLLYELTVGKRLFRVSSFESMRRVLDEPIPPPTFARAGYPVDLEMIVMHALERNPADRYTSAEDMLEDLEQFAFDLGLRLSRLRLGRFVSRILGMPEKADAPSDPEEPEEKASVEPAGEDLDFDRESSFEPLLTGQAAVESKERPGARRVSGVLAAVQQASAAMAELEAAAEGAAGTSATPSPEEGATVDLRGAARPKTGLMSELEPEEDATVELRAARLPRGEHPGTKQNTVELRPEGGARPRGRTSRREEPSVQEVSMVEAIDVEEVSAPRRTVDSAVVVTDEQVEEELDLSSESALPEPSPPSPDAGGARGLARGAEESRGAALPSPRGKEKVAKRGEARGAAKRGPRGEAPDASPELLEALADLTAELRANEESDRRREDAIAFQMDRIDGEPLERNTADLVSDLLSSPPPTSDLEDATVDIDPEELIEVQLEEERRAADALESADLLEPPPIPESLDEPSGPEVPEVPEVALALTPAADAPAPAPPPATDVRTEEPFAASSLDDQQDAAASDGLDDETVEIKVPPQAVLEALFDETDTAQPLWAPEPSAAATPGPPASPPASPPVAVEPAGSLEAAERTAPPPPPPLPPPAPLAATSRVASPSAHAPRRTTRPPFPSRLRRGAAVDQQRKSLARPRRAAHAGRTPEASRTRDHGDRPGPSRLAFRALRRARPEPRRPVPPPRRCRGFR